MTGDKRPHSSSSSFVNSSDATRTTTTARNASGTVRASMEEDRFQCSTVDCITRAATRNAGAEAVGGASTGGASTRAIDPQRRGTRTCSAPTGICRPFVARFGADGRANMGLGFLSYARTISGTSSPNKRMRDCFLVCLFSGEET
jgi:hypothetical protein